MISTAYYSIRTHFTLLIQENKNPESTFFISVVGAGDAGAENLLLKLIKFGQHCG